MARLELSGAVKAFIATEINRLCEELVEPVPGLTVEILRGVFRDTRAVRSSSARLPSYAATGAVDSVCLDVTTTLNNFVEYGFGVCNVCVDLSSAVGEKLRPVRNEALHMALLERGIETRESDLGFIRFTTEEHRRLAESCVPIEIMQQTLENAQHNRKLIDDHRRGARKRAREAASVAEEMEKRAKKAEEETAEEERAFDARLERLRVLVAERSKVGEGQ